MRSYQHNNPRAFPQVIACRRGDACGHEARDEEGRFRRAQTSGKVERFNRTLLDEWAYTRVYTSNSQRTRALDRWLHLYNHHRGHTALGGQPPVTHATNLAGQHI